LAGATKDAAISIESEEQAQKKNDLERLGFFKRNVYL
jgi:hypothetical protein